jgi:hypothetical protein
MESTSLIQTMAHNSARCQFMATKALIEEP